jgi:hypothetical protein
MGESYWTHAKFALAIGFRMLGAGVACIIHAIVPELFKTTASTQAQQVLVLMASRRRSSSL